MYKKFKPHLLMVLAQIGLTILYVVTEASFNQGLNPHVYITYRLIISGFLMWPFANFLERKLRPKLTWALFLEICVLSLVGVSLSLNMYFASLKYTSPTFIASVFNTVSSLTFVIAVSLGMERLDIKSSRGMAKVFGTLISLGGVTIMTLYKGLPVRSCWHPLMHLPGNQIHEDWVKGSILVVSSCITWSIWYIMQATVLKKYPAPLSLTTWMSFIGAALSAVFTACIEHKPAVWITGFGIKLWSTLYAGIVCSGLITFVQLWCIEEKGPVFVSTFNPLSSVIVALLAFFVFGERLYMGSILGGIIVIVGLYLFLWGKERDKEVDPIFLEPSSTACDIREVSSQEAVKHYASQGRMQV